MIQACETLHTDVSVQSEPDFDDKFQAMLLEKDTETEQLKNENDNEIRALKNELKVRNLAMFYSNFMETLTCVFV
jgi:hypothetical protein